MRSLGKKPCMVGWNLNPLTPYSSISLRASRTPSLPLCGSMLTKGINTSEFSAATSQHLVIVVAAESGLTLGVDRKNHRSDFLGAIVGRGFRNRRRMLVRRLEVFGHLRLEVVVAVVAMHAAGLFRMGVDVDRNHFIDVGDFRFCHSGIHRPPGFRKLIIPYNEFGKLRCNPGPTILCLSAV